MFEKSRVCYFFRITNIAHNIEQNVQKFEKMYMDLIKAAA